MKTVILLCVSCLFVIPTTRAQLPQESQEFLEESLNRTNFGEIPLDAEELLPQFTRYDFGELWTAHSQRILGFIGDGYQRLRIRYLAVIRDVENPGRYYVFGRRSVRDSVCQFIGEIRLLHVRMFNERERQQRYESAVKEDDGNGVVYYSHTEYTLLAEYRFFEDATRGGTGYFEGVLRSDFLLDDSGRVLYDDVHGDSDAWCNNQYVGTWRRYTGDSVERCNWGDRRIPHSGNLDMGAVDFSPVDEYLANGWETYRRATFSSPEDSAAVAEEAGEWWKED